MLSSNSLHGPDVRQSSVVEQEGCRLGELELVAMAIRRTRWL